MQNKVVLDSCVFNKLFLKEPDSEVAIELITFLTEKDFLGIKRCLPPLLVEIAYNKYHDKVSICKLQ